MNENSNFLRPSSTAMRQNGELAEGMWNKGEKVIVGIKLRWQTIRWTNQKVWKCL